MKLLSAGLFLFFFLVSSIDVVRAEITKDCEDKLVQEMAKLIKEDHKDVLKLQFQITTLKLTRSVLDNHFTTLESMLKSKVDEVGVKDEETLKKLKEMYAKYGKEADLERLDKLFTNANYYQPKQRIQNEDLSLFLLTQTMVDQDQLFPVDENDVAITWFYSEVQKKYKPFSSEYNLKNLSNLLALKTGGIKADLKLSPAEVEDQLKSNTDALAVHFQEMTTELLKNKDNKCFSEWQQAICDQSDYLQGLLPRSMLELKDFVQDFSQDKVDNADVSEVIIDQTKTNVNTVKQVVEVTQDKQGKTTPTIVLKGPLKTQKKFSGENPPTWLPGWAKQYYNDFVTKYENYDDVRKRQNSLNKLDERTKIVEFSKLNETQNYVVVDEVKGLMTIYSPSGKILSESKINNDHVKNDKIGGGKNTAAGIYSVSGTSNGKINFKNEKGGASNIVLIGSSSQHKNMAKYLNVHSKIYVLPEEPGNKFVVKNNKLNFTTTSKSITNYGEYNFSPKSRDYFATNFYINDDSVKNKVSTKFMQAIGDEKKTIMGLYNLDSDEYNELARVAFGILGQETDFGRSSWYGLKETVPLLVAWSKGNSTTASNSRGLTQMKSVPAKIYSKYGIKKEHLNNPRLSAIATMGFLAELLAELKVKEKGFSKITPENRYDYIQYLYRGDVSEITKKTATPEQNTYLKGMKKSISKLTIYQERVPSAKI